MDGLEVALGDALIELVGVELTRGDSEGVLDVEAAGVLGSGAVGLALDVAEGEPLPLDDGEIELFADGVIEHLPRQLLAQ